MCKNIFTIYLNLYPMTQPNIIYILYCMCSFVLSLHNSELKNRRIPMLKRRRSLPGYHGNVRKFILKKKELQREYWKMRLDGSLLGTELEKLFSYIYFVLHELNIKPWRET